MKKLITLLLASAFLLLSTNAFAFNRIKSYWDLNAVDNAFFIGDDIVGGAWADDGVTTSFSELGYYAETRSVINLLAGTVDDSGHGHIDELFTGVSPSDTENYFLTSNVTFAWDNLKGNVTYSDATRVEASYYQGTINFYMGYNKAGEGFGYNYGATDPLFIDSVLSTFTDGTKIATIEITSGSYELDLTGGAGSSYILNGKFTFLLDNFWFSEDGEDLSDDLLGKEYVMAYSAGDTDPNNTIIDTSGGLTSTTVISPHDSSIEVGIVPEPTTMALFGIGLLCAAGLARKED